MQKACERAWERLSLVGGLIHRKEPILAHRSTSRRSLHAGEQTENSLIRYSLSPFPSLWALANPDVPLQEIRGIVIFLHGTGSYMADSMSFGAEASLHCNILFIGLEYPGYRSERDQRPTVLHSQLWTVKFIRYLMSAFDKFNESRAQLQPLPFPHLFVVGHCLGASCALAAAKELPKAITGIVLINAFETLKNMLRRQLGSKISLLLWLFRNHMDHLALIKDVQVPIYGVTCEYDNLSPEIVLRQLLGVATRSPYRKLSVLKNRCHSWSLAAEGYLLFPSLREFMDAAASAQGKAKAKAKAKDEICCNVISVAADASSTWTPDNAKFREEQIEKCRLDLVKQHALLRVHGATATPKPNPKPTIGEFVHFYLTMNHDSLRDEVAFEEKTEKLWMSGLVFAVVFCGVLCVLAVVFILSGKAKTRGKAVTTILSASPSSPPPRDV